MMIPDHNNLLSDTCTYVLSLEWHSWSVQVRISSHLKRPMPKTTTNASFARVLETNVADDRE